MHPHTFPALSHAVKITVSTAYKRYYETQNFAVTKCNASSSRHYSMLMPFKKQGAMELRTLETRMFFNRAPPLGIPRSRLGCPLLVNYLETTLGATPSKERWAIRRRIYHVRSMRRLSVAMIRSASTCGRLALNSDECATDAGPITSRITLESAKLWRALASSPRPYRQPQSRQVSQADRRVHCEARDCQEIQSRADHERRYLTCPRSKARQQLGIVVLQETLENMIR